jgi:hypothetical protein
MRSKTSSYSGFKPQLLLTVYLVAAFTCAALPALWLLRRSLGTDIVEEPPERLPVSRLFAVVVPLGSSADLVTLRANFRYWRPNTGASGAAPCLFSKDSERSGKANLEDRPDLVVLTSRALNVTDRTRIVNEFERNAYCRNCFRSIRFLDCGLKPEHDVYNMTKSGTISSRFNGPLLTFVCSIGHNQIWNNYHAIFLMELDAVPIQNNWLSEVEIEARNLAREQLLAVQSGCSLTEDKSRGSWRNGSPALYRVGFDAQRFFLQCFKHFWCIPTLEESCGFPWDSYIHSCRLQTPESMSLFGVSCRFIHVGSLWHMRRASKSIWTTASSEALRSAVFIHSGRVIREIDETVTALEQKIREADASGVPSEEN